MDEHTTGSPECWLDEHGAALYKYALRHTRDEHRAEDIVQETLLAALQARDRFTAGASVRTWLIGILKHKMMDLFRRDAREVSMPSTEEREVGDEALTDGIFDAAGHWQDKPSDWGNPAEMLERDQFLTVLQHCLNALPPRLSQVFWLREVMEEDAEIVCQELAITPTNLWTMLYRSRLGIRKCLDKGWFGHSSQG